MDDSIQPPRSIVADASERAIKDAEEMCIQTKWHIEMHRLSNMFPLMDPRELNGRTDDYVRRVGIKEAEMRDYCPLCLDSYAKAVADGTHKRVPEFFKKALADFCEKFGKPRYRP